MTQDPKKKKAMTTELEEEGDDEDSEKAKKISKITPYLKTLPNAMTKFKNLPGEKKPVSPSLPNRSDSKSRVSLEGPFGVGPFIFPALQRFNNIYFFLFLLFMTIVAHGTLFGLVDQSLKQMDKGFSLTQNEKFIMDFSDYYAAFLVAIFVAYYGGRGNKPRWVAISAFMLGISSIIFAVPYYKYKIVTPVKLSDDLCRPEERNTKTECEEMLLPYRSRCINLFILAQCLHGVTGMPIYILGLTFLYEHIPTFSAGFYIGITNIAHVLGYTLGYLIGVKGLMPVQNQTLSEGTNENLFRWWQSLWWRSFSAVALLTWCTFLPLVCFPTRLPDSQKIRLEKENESVFNNNLKNMHFGPHLKDFVQTIKCMLRNPLLIYFSLCKATESLTLRGAAEFVPIYLENQFLLTPSLANMLTGMIILPGTAIANIVGGLIVDRLEMSCKNKIRFVVVTSTVALVIFILILFVECETVKFAGINEDYDGTGNFGNLTAPCNSQCDCPSSLYTPICGRDDREYFSACFAGCKSSKHFNDEKTYYNCSCIKEGLTSADIEGDFVDAIAGKCSSKCHSLPLFFAFFFSSIFFSGMGSIPVILIILQLSPIDFNSVSLGVTYTIWRMSGSIIGPPVFKTSLYESCIYWNINKCGIRGRCLIYNKSSIVYILMGLCVFFQASSAFLSVLSLYKFGTMLTESTVSLAKSLRVVNERKEQST